MATMINGPKATNNPLTARFHARKIAKTPGKKKSRFNE